ncbi:MAG: hypothetical protein WCP18_02190 [bacterium]
MTTKTEAGPTIHWFVPILIFLLALVGLIFTGYNNNQLNQKTNWQTTTDIPATISIPNQLRKFRSQQATATEQEKTKLIDKTAVFFISHKQELYNAQTYAEMAVIKGLLDYQAIEKKDPDFAQLVKIGIILYAQQDINTFRSGKHSPTCCAETVIKLKDLDYFLKKNIITLDDLKITQAEFNQFFE